MTRFGEARAYFPLGTADSFAPTDSATVASGAGGDVFGAWVQLVADVGVNKKLVGLAVNYLSTAQQNAELEVGEGEAGSEAAVARHMLAAENRTVAYVVYVNKRLTNNARLSVRLRDEGALVYSWKVSPIIV